MGKQNVQAEKVYWLFEESFLIPLIPLIPLWPLAGFPKFNAVALYNS